MSAILSPPDMSIEECADIARVSVSTIKRDIADGRLVATRYRGCTRIAVGDFEDYRKRCRSAGTVQAGKSVFSTMALDLPKLLGLTETPRNTRGASSKESQIIALADRRATRSKKR
jgi:hypothetical protein